MKPSYLQKFIAPDQTAFGVLLRHLGFVSAACYRMDHNELTLLFASETTSDSDWPAALTYEEDYTPNREQGLPIGWVRAPNVENGRKPWPKGTNLYVPDQDIFDIKIVIAVRNAPGRRCRLGEMYGPLEAVATRVRHWLNLTAERYDVANEAFSNHLQAVGTDLQELIDHELRTPLSSIAGYMALLKDFELTQRNAPELKKHLEVVHTQTQHAVAALEKLSLTMTNRLSTELTAEPTQPTDLAAIANEVVEEAKTKLPLLLQPDDTRKFRLLVRQAGHQDCTIIGAPRLLKMALWEVLKNAITHAHHGQIIVTVYRTDNRIVLDVEDDGKGVALGAEELIFLRFFQEPATMQVRRGRRGLGLGLYISRFIAEKHSGNVRYVRKEKVGLFRFMFPAAEHAATTGTAPVQLKKVRRSWIACSSSKMKFTSSVCCSFCSKMRVGEFMLSTLVRRLSLSSRKMSLIWFSSILFCQVWTVSKL
jgi:signal transduction histidine kinase